MPSSSSTASPCWTPPSTSSSPDCSHHRPPPRRPPSSPLPFSYGHHELPPFPSLLSVPATPLVAPLLCSSTTTRAPPRASRLARHPAGAPCRASRRRARPGSPAVAHSGHRLRPAHATPPLASSPSTSPCHHHLQPRPSAPAPPSRFATTPPPSPLVLAAGERRGCPAPLGHALVRAMPVNQRARSSGPLANDSRGPQPRTLKK